MERWSGGPVIAALATLLTLSIPSLGLAETKSLVRISVTTREELSRLPRALDVAGGSQGRWIDAVATPEKLREIRATGLPTAIIHQDLEAYLNSVKGYYHTFPQLISDLEFIATVFSSISRLDTLGTTYEGRPLVIMKISDNVAIDEGNEPELFFMGLHHAREWPSLEIAYHIAETLIFNYGLDPHITEVVDSREIWVMPCVNPDGYAYCHDQGNDWRKNRRFFPEYNSYGVDLNRNYNGSVNGDPEGAWGTTRTYGTTHNPWESVYCGPFPFSEVETRVVRDFFQVHDFVFSVSYHTYYQVVIWPWAYSGSKASPDSALIGDIGAQMASRIARQSGIGNYDAAQAPAIGYTTTGDTDDWAYGYCHYVAGSNCLPYTVEACDEFQPPEPSLDQIVQENFEGALYLCDIADSVAAQLTPRVMPPVIDPISPVAGGDFTVSWRPTNPAAQADRYHLDELSGSLVITDDAEDLNALWDLDGFSRSTARFHSSGSSYQSSSDLSDACDAMTSAQPCMVSPEDSLTFWCWYDIEEAWDMAYAELSTDGRRFQLADSTATFTGTSGGWIRKAYSLADYAGASVIFRFRYTTDEYTEGEGFYVDDIHPVASYGNVDTVSAAIADTFSALTARPPGNYAYRVRGYNAPRGWGNWSCLRGVTVLAGPTPPESITDLVASPLNGILLSWSPVTTDTIGGPVTIDHYVIHRDTIHDFVASPANSLSITADTFFLDEAAGVGNVGINHFYLLRAVDGASNKSKDSNRVGEFDRYIQRWK